VGGDLEATLRARREAGGPALVAYVTGGAPSLDAALLRSIAEAGADAIEVGIPFSDPVMDGPVIQEASRLALERGTTPFGVLSTIAEAGLDVPVAVMTYFNPVFRRGLERFLADATAAGVGGVIVPDLPVDEADGWIEVCAAASVAPVFLAAPGSSSERLRRIAGSARGFVYCVSTFGVTGEREALASTAERLVADLRPLTDLPLLVGVGISTPEQAVAVCTFADGVVIGSAIVRRLLAGDADGAVDLVGSFRAALPVGGQSLPSR
jgi:tryptophan synthase alpha chain